MKNRSRRQRSAPSAELDDIAEGLALIDIARGQDPPLQVVVITGSDSKRAALEAVKHGAYGFFEKPLDPGELLHIVNQAARMRQLEIENRSLCAKSCRGRRDSLI